MLGRGVAGARSASVYVPTLLLRSRNHRPGGRRRHAGVSGRLRNHSRTAGFASGSFCCPVFEHERALLSLVAELAAGAGHARHLQRPFVRRAADRDALSALIACRFRFGDMPHLDMLHPARRLWKQRPTIAGPPLDDDSCKLSVLERHLAGYHRVGDVPGFEIPSRYFRFVREGDAHPLEAVLEHNRIDLISLALVTARAITLIGAGPAATHASARSARTRARLRARRAQRRTPRRALRTRRRLPRASAASRTCAPRRCGGWRYAGGGRDAWREAAAAWEELLDSARVSRGAAARSARSAGDPSRASLARPGLGADRSCWTCSPTASGARAREAAEYRLQRIERKIARHVKQGGLMAALEDVGSSV